jgi:autotransporter translocation and assembly factor TamB
MSKIILSITLVSLIVLGVACGGSATSGTGKAIKSGPAGNNMTVTLSSADGVLRDGQQDITLSFTDAAGKPVDVGAASLNFHMPAMGTMPVMNDAATLTTTGTPGVYNGKVKLQMAGEWQAQITYDGAAGKGKVNLPVTAQ